MVKVANVDSCSGCLACCLACSFFATPERVFSLSRSSIKVRQSGGEKRFDIEFTEECTQCGICVAYCQYDVLREE